MREINILDYINEAEKLEKLISEFINLCEEYKKAYRHGLPSLKLTDIAKPVQRELLRKYEIWFAVTKLISRQYSDKNSEFEDNYVKVKDFILIKDPDYSRRSYLNNLIDSFDIQVNILHAIIPIIPLKETNFKKLITADLLDSELSQAEHLYKNDFFRAAGAITGVILERYLKTLCEVNQINIGDNDTIEPLATKLYKSEKIPEFDVTLFKSIQHLASIRNKCDHPKEEPKQHEVRELLDKVKKITYLGL